MPPKHLSAREEYRQQEHQRTQDSASLAERFLELKSLTVDLTHFGPEGLNKTSEMKYTANLTHAKSRFRFNCSNAECVGGDFDLSMALAEAVATRQATVTGEVTCRGWRSKTTVDRVHCYNILRYRLSLEY